MALQVYATKWGVRVTTITGPEPSRFSGSDRNTPSATGFFLEARFLPHLNGREIEDMDPDQ